MPDASTPSSTSSEPPPDIKFQPPSSGSFWSEVQLAYQVSLSSPCHRLIISIRVECVKGLWEPLNAIEKIPCARNSLLSGIASGAGIGVIRGISAGEFLLHLSINWALLSLLNITQEHSSHRTGLLERSCWCLLDHGTQ